MRFGRGSLANRGEMMEIAGGPGETRKGGIAAVQ